ncbi:MAG: DNA repair exonuclease [Candidatus Bilamarchaeaceae archaeon]
MKIGILGDLHLGYSRFEEDSYIQAERALRDASNKADIVIVAGDIFDSRIPKLETIKKAVEIFKSLTVPTIAIHGNHERRTKGFDNPISVLASAGAVIYLSSSEYTFEKNNERITVIGIGSVPEEYAEETIAKLVGNFTPSQEGFRIFVIHQNVNELVNQTGVSLDFLSKLPFDLIINGHIHAKHVKLGGKLVIPGSTVITQLKKEETQAKGYYLFDTVTRKLEFVEIPTRKFFYEELRFSGASERDVVSTIVSRIDEIRNGWRDAIIALKLTGSLREGLRASDIRLRVDDPLVFITNELNVADIKERIEEIKKISESNISIKEFGRMQLEKRIGDKIKLFKPSELFEKLIEEPDIAETYLMEIIEGRAQG